MSLVSFVRIETNATNSIKDAISDSLRLIDYSFGKEIKNVVIKPNLCYYWDYTTGQTTDPKFVSALIELIQERINPDIISIAESDASAMKCIHVFKMLGFEKLSRDYGVKLVNLSEDKVEIVRTTIGAESLHLAVPQTIRDADLKINLPKIKYTFRGIEISCALKNVFGCQPYRRKSRYHPRLGEVIVSINKVMKFDLCIIDGNIVSGIKPRRLGLVMASKDPVAIDAAAARIAGINPRTIGYIKLAQKEGLGNMRCVPRGMPLSYFGARYPRRDTRNKLMGMAYTAAVKLDLSRRLGLE